MTPRLHLLVTLWLLCSHGIYAYGYAISTSLKNKTSSNNSKQKLQKSNKKTRQTTTLHNKASNKKDNKSDDSNYHPSRPTRYINPKNVVNINYQYDEIQKENTLFTEETYVFKYFLSNSNKTDVTPRYIELSVWRNNAISQNDSIKKETLFQVFQRLSVYAGSLIVSKAEKNTDSLNNKKGVYVAPLIVDNGNPSHNKTVTYDRYLSTNKGESWLWKVKGEAAIELKEAKIYVDNLVVDGEEDIIATLSKMPKEAFLEMEVVTPNKQPQKLAEQTLSLNLLSKRNLLLWNVNELEEGLDKVGGVSMMDGQVNIRGGNGYAYGIGSRVQVLLDDMPFLRADAAFPAWSFVPVENIEQVEVVKGATSSLYGSSALNGIVHIRTATPSYAPTTKLDFSSSIFQNPRQDGSERKLGKALPVQSNTSILHSQTNGKLGWLVGANSFVKNSWREAEYERRGRLHFKTIYQAHKRLKLGLNGQIQNYNNGAHLFGNGSGREAFNLNKLIDPMTDKGIIARLDPSIKYNNLSTNTSHKLMGRYYKSVDHNNQDKSNNSDVLYGEYQFQKGYSYYDLTLTAGLSGMYTHTNSELYGNTIHTASNLAAYMQFDKTFFERLNVSLGARIENNQLDKQWAPRLLPVISAGANYKVGKKTYLRASFGQGYRFPTIAEKFTNTVLVDSVGIEIFDGLIAAIPIHIFPNEELKPETGYTVELGGKHGINIGSWDGFVDAAAFYSHYSDMVEFDFNQNKVLYVGNFNALEPEEKLALISNIDGVGFYAKNIGDIVINGYDIAIGGSGKTGIIPLSFLIAYTYTNATYKDFTLDQQYSSSSNSNVLKYRFKHTVKGDFATRYKGLSLGVALKYNSRIEAIDQVFAQFITGIDESLKSALVVDARTAYQISKQGQIQFLCKNIFNSQYHIRPALVEAPRNYTIRYTHEF